jgi:hypothetical protein
MKKARQGWRTNPSKMIFDEKGEEPAEDRNNSKKSAPKFVIGIEHAVLKTTTNDLTTINIFGGPMLFFLKYYKQKHIESIIYYITTVLPIIYQSIAFHFLQ